MQIGGGAMTNRQVLHELVDQLPHDQAELDAAALASLDRGLADVSEGRVKPLEKCERGPGLRLRG
jgi:hypothetical protein